MAAAGCLFLVIFPLIGFVGGLLLAGLKIGLWAAGAGFALAAAIAGISGYALVKAGRRH